MAVGKNNFPQLISGEADRRSVFGGSQRDRNLVAGLHGSPGPVIPPQNARALAFDRPIYGRAFIGFYVQKYLAMRVGPYEFRNRARNADPVRLVVSRISVMRPRRAAYHNDTRNPDSGCCQPKFHVTTSQI